MYYKILCDKKTKYLEVGLIILFQVLGSFSTRSQTLDQPQKLYIGMGDLDTKIRPFVTEKNINTVIILDSRHFDPKNDGNLDYDLFVNAVKTEIPDSLTKGIVVLDWEGKDLEALRFKAPRSREFKRASKAFINLIKFAKSLRPDIEWGYYGVPFTTYWKRDNDWRSRGTNIKLLLSQCDILFPTFYTYYKAGSVSKDDNETFARDNMKEMLALGKMVNKPVMPFVWHRYHPNNKQIGLELIPINEFTDYIAAILNVNYEGTKAAGVVWWGADNYYYNVKSKPLLNEFKESGQKNFDDYKDSLIMEYGSGILQKLKN